MSPFGVFVLLLLSSVFPLTLSQTTIDDLGDVKRLTLSEYFTNTDAEVADLLKNGTLTRIEYGLSCYRKDQYQQLNIFNGSLPVAELLHFYYNQTFPEKTITKESILNLLQSTAWIIKTCWPVNPLNSENSIKFAFTSLSDWSKTQFEGSCHGIRNNAPTAAASFLKVSAIFVSTFFAFNFGFF